MLTLMSVLTERSKDGHVQWLCQCSCGDVGTYLATRVKHNRVAGCQKCAHALTGSRVRTHGMRNTATYSSWISIKDRCTNPESKDFARYGGKGITVCDQWLNSFEQFYKDMGEKPNGTSIDRINNDQGYSPKNCRWATHSQQQLTWLLPPCLSPLNFFIFPLSFSFCLLDIALMREILTLVPKV